MSVPENRAVVGRADAINRRDRPFETIISHSDLDEVLEEWRSQKVAGAIMKFFDATQYYSLLTLVFIKKILSYSKYIVGFLLSIWQ